ncbi:MAG: hypothetical protein HC927_06805 [Deltaproteobacteria bacterium]|nr:hypothetical protein [Deltaproteobacteria bacterium]
MSTVHAAQLLDSLDGVNRAEQTRGLEVILAVDRPETRSLSQPLQASPDAGQEIVIGHALKACGYVAARAPLLGQAGGRQHAGPNRQFGLVATTGPQARHPFDAELGENLDRVGALRSAEGLSDDEHTRAVTMSELVVANRAVTFVGASVDIGDLEGLRSDDHVEPLWAF